MAIEQALMVVSWQENMPSKEIPPDHLWEDIEGLNEWFKALREERDAPSDQQWSSEKPGSEYEGGDEDFGQEPEPWQRPQQPGPGGDDDAGAGQGVGPGGSTTGAAPAGRPGAKPGAKPGMASNDLARMFRER